MFHTIITLAYIIPNIYVYLRIWHLFINKGYKVLYTAIYILLLSVYPLGNILSARGPNFPSEILNGVSDYLLPFWLYFFLFVLLFDILLLLNKLIRLIPSESLKSNNFKKKSLSSILFLSVAVVIAGVINFKTIQTTEYRIDIPGRSSALRHLRIAFVADFHLKQGTSIKFVERFVKKIGDNAPDLMLFGGDIAEGRGQQGMTVYEDLLKRINAKYGVYGVLGNHEYYSGQDKGRFFERAGIKLLCDTNIVIDGLFNLSGRYDSHFASRKQVDELMQSVTDSLPVIMLDHRPTELDQVSKTFVDVQFSGHTHNGQMFPINLITRSVYELSCGYLKKGNTHFFVTSGIRLWGPPVRTAGKSEIMIVNINFLTP